jgi:hypothetical protein
LRDNIRAIAAFAVMLVTGTVNAAEPPKDLAELFPPGTLAYAELHNPAELAPQLASVFKGTILEDNIPFIHGRKDAAKTLMELGSKRQAALLGLFASPEMLAEFKKIRVAGGITGFTEQGDPDGVIAILTHDSPSAGIAARAYLTMTPQLRKVAEVSKVPVFQYRAPNINYDPNGQPLIQHEKAFSDGPHELTFAYTPGLIAIGTSKTAVGHVIKRFLCVEKGEGLAANATFKEATASHRQTGLFFYVNYSEYSTKFGTATRIRGMPRGDNFDLRSILAGGEAELYEWFNLTANPKAVKTLAGCVRFRDGGIAATVVATFDESQKSPLLDLLSGPGVKLELLHHAQRPATFGFTVTLPEKNRAERAIAFLDALAKVGGEVGRLPHDVVKELGDKYKLAVADGLIGKVHAVTVLMPTRQELPKGGKAGPMLVLHTDDAAASAAWEDFLPKLLGDLGGGNPPQPSSETISGVKVFTVPGVGLRWNAPVHFARSGSVVAIGLDRKLVAGAVTANAAASVIGGDKAVSPPGAPAALFGVVSLGEVIPALFEKPRPTGPVVPVDEPPVFRNGQPIPEGLIEELKKARKELATALAGLSPATVTARRKGAELHFEVFLPKVQNGSLKTLIEAAANWIDRSSSVNSNPNDPYQREIYGRW